MEYDNSSCRVFKNKLYAFPYEEYSKVFSFGLGNEEWQSISSDWLILLLNINEWMATFCIATATICLHTCIHSGGSCYPDWLALYYDHCTSNEASPTPLLYSPRGAPCSCITDPIPSHPLLLASQPDSQPAKPGARIKSTTAASTGNLCSSASSTDPGGCTLEFTQSSLSSMKPHSLGPAC